MRALAIAFMVLLLGYCPAVASPPPEDLDKQHERLAMKAIKNEDARALRYLVNLGYVHINVTLNDVGYIGTYLSYAVGGRCDPAIVQILLDAGADPNFKDVSDFNARPMNELIDQTFISLPNGRADSAIRCREALKLVLQAGGDPDTKTTSFPNALSQFAGAPGYPHFPDAPNVAPVAIFRAAGANPNAATREGNTPAMLIALAGWAPLMLKALIDTPVAADARYHPPALDLSLENRWHETALEIALACKALRLPSRYRPSDVQIVKILQDAGSPPPRAGVGKCHF